MPFIIICCGVLVGVAGVECVYSLLLLLLFNLATTYNSFIYYYWKPFACVGGVIQWLPEMQFTTTAVLANETAQIGSWEFGHRQIGICRQMYIFGGICSTSTSLAMASKKWTVVFSILYSFSLSHSISLLLSFFFSLLFLSSRSLSLSLSFPFHQSFSLLIQRSAIWFRLSDRKYQWTSLPPPASFYSLLLRALNELSHK